MTQYQAMYVTGAPASGKTTLIKNLAEIVSPLKPMEYGDRLLEFLQRDIPTLTRDELRARSAELVTPATIAQLDTKLLDSLPSILESTHVVMGSHAVTHESFGVRVTAFSQRDLDRLPLSAVVVLDCPPAQLVERIAAKSSGRTWSTVEEAERLQRLQITLALQYGVVCGCPVFVIDAGDEPKQLANKVRSALLDGGIFVS